MPVTILSPEISISRFSRLGGTVTDREILYRLADRGYNIEVILPENEDYIPHNNIKVHTIAENLFLKSSYLINLFFLKKTADILSSKKIDILRIHSPYSIGLGAALLKVFKKCPPIWLSYLHIEDRIDWSIIDRFLPHIADGITLLSEDTLSDLKQRFKFLDNKVVNIVPEGINTTLFHRIENPIIDEKLEISLEKPIILFVGSLIKRKGIDLLLEIWRELLCALKDIQLLIIGDGPLRSEVLNFKSHNPNLFYLEYVPQDILANYYSAADIFLFPTLKEGFGMVVGEAMACELPVVISDASGVRKLVLENETGFKVKIGDAAGFVDVLKRLLENPDMRIQMGRRGRNRISKHYSWDKSIEKAECFIENLLKR